MCVLYKNVYLQPVRDNHSGCSVARLSRRVWDAEVAGSNPATPTKKSLVNFSLQGFFSFSGFPAVLRNATFKYFQFILINGHFHNRDLVCKVLHI